MCERLRRLPLVHIPPCSASQDHRLRVTYRCSSPVDDFDSSQPADETVRYSFDGVDYEVDLTGTNAAEFREQVQRYIAVNRRVGGREGRAKPSSGQDTQKIREWAKANGIKVSGRGRIAQSVVEQYEQAQR